VIITSAPHGASEPEAIMPVDANTNSLNEDRRIEQDIRAECRDISDIRSLGISVEGGVVHLTGSTETYSQKWAIERAAGRVIGVTEVRDHLEVRPVDEDHRDDRQLQSAATAVLRWDARVPDGVRVSVTDGVLRLDGVVGRFADREAAEEAVRNLVGVRDVVNEIKLIPTHSSPDLLSEVQAMVRRRFASGGRFLSVSVQDGVVRLRGTVPAYAVIDDVERSVRSIPGVKRIDNQLLVGSEEAAS
jgi:osmotically-inducible protein OsmY